MFNIKICVSYFVRGLPPIPAFNSLRTNLPRRITAIDNDQDFGAFIGLTEMVLELNTIFKPTVQSQTVHPSRPPPPAVSSAPVLPALPSATAEPPRASKKEQICNNCKSRGLRAVGHTDGTCFQPGGGMEGRREEYFNNKGRIHAMFAECLENAFLVPDSSLPPALPSNPTSPVLSPALNNELLVPSFANLSVATFMPNTDLCEDTYIHCDLRQPPQLALASIDFNSAALVSLVNLYNALLDSGCTHHIIRDCTLFRSYAAQTISVGTANCSSLEALGNGDVEFQHPYGERHVTFTLRGCLYAPSAPINLLSVGALTECGMSCLFSPGGVTKIFYPEDHPRIPGFSLSATVVNCLSFLQLSFIYPERPMVPTAFPAQVTPPLPAYSFPLVKLDTILWHRRLVWMLPRLP